MRKNVWEKRETRSVSVAFRKPSRQSFFSSRISPFSPGNRYFYEMSKRMIGQVSHQVSRRIKNKRNRRYCEKCIVTGSLSHKIVHKNRARTCRNMRNDKCIASSRVSFHLSNSPQSSFNENSPNFYYQALLTNLHLSQF